jgi:hypothetical protein
MIAASSAAISAAISAGRVEAAIYLADEYFPLIKLGRIYGISGY